MSKQLEREIQRLLDAGESPSEKLATELEANAELKQAAQEFEQLDALLGEWSAAPLELDEDVFVRRISQRLEEQLAPLEHDPTLPPAFDDDDSKRRPGDEHSGEFALAALTDQVSEPEVSQAPAAAASFAQPPAMEPQPAGKVVQLDSKRSSQTWVFAAAAVVGLVAAGGLFMVNGTSDESSVAMVQPSEAARFEGAAYEMDQAAPAPEAAATGSAARVQAVAEATEEPEQEILAANGARGGRTEVPGAPATSAPAEDRAFAMAARRRVTMTSAYTEAAIEQVAAPQMRARMSARGQMRQAQDPAKTTVIRRTRARVFGCFETRPDSVRVQVWVDGRTGRVREVDVPSGGRPNEVECVRRAVRSAQFSTREGVARYTTILEY